MNTVLVGIDLQLNKNLLKWFAYIICNSNYVSQTRHELDKYYKECTVALVIMECLKKLEQATSEQTTTDTYETNYPKRDKYTGGMVK